MGKKKIIFLLLLFMFLNMHTYSQTLFTEELHWKENKEFVNDLYVSMKNFVNDTTPVIVKYNKIPFYEMNLFDLFDRIFKKKKIDKQLTLQKRIEQQEVKNFLEAHFVFHDTILELVFFDKNQIIEWSKSIKISPFMPFPIVQSKEFNLSDKNILILMIDGCSGVRCLKIYVFAQENENWKLITGADTNIREFINLRIDKEEKRIIFETKSGQIGELPFEMILNSD